MKNYYFLFLMIGFYSLTGFSQGITVDDTSYNSQDMAGMLLNDACAEISNASMSSQSSVAYFNDNSSDFPLSEGVVIRSGRAKYSEGIYTGENLSSQDNTNGDADLQAINDASGQPSNISDVAFLQFDFVPLSDSFNFNFLFASNEYGQWQCVSSDVFAFLLTNLDTGETENIAVLPGSATPVSVKTIRDKAYNPGCISQHPNLFDTYNVAAPLNSSINMRGYTKVLNASAEITPGAHYRIRLVIGDSNDTNFDSAIFLESGSFDTSLDLGEDRTICEGDIAEIGTGLSTTDYTHVWKRNGQIIPNENGSTLTVTQPGNYEAIVSKIDSNCTFSDQVTFEDLYVQPPHDLFVCNSGADEYTYDLTQNNASSLGLDADIYQVFYYASEADVQANNPIPENELASYTDEINTTIFIKIFNTQTGHFCNAEYPFDLDVNPVVTATSPDPIEVCYSPSGYEIDLSQIDQQVLNGQPANAFAVSYYYFQQSAEIGALAISNSGAFPLLAGFSSKTLWARVENAQDPNCFAVVDFDILEHPLPPVSELQDTIRCLNFVLPPIAHGDYYTQNQGNGDLLNAGDTITKNGTYYIFNGPDENGCSNQSDFKVTLVDKYDVSGTYCDHFTVPSPTVGQFYTAIDGPDGNGDIIPAGTVLETDQTIYYYAVVNGELCKNEPFDIDVHPLPPVDQPDDVVTCDSYVLPPLEHGDYFTSSGGNGNQLAAGDVIGSSKKIYVFADDGTCTNQNTFDIIIIPDFPDVTACGSYTLPQLEAGGYFTQAQGQGAQIPQGTEITTSQTVFVYAETTEQPNCTNDLSFDITIKPIPPVDSLDDVNLCDGDSYTLPSLDNGSYFSESDRNGDELHPGDVIDSTQDIYINNIRNGCTNETKFTVTIHELPPIANFTDIYSCGAYELPEPADGQVFTEPNGQGEMVAPGQMITSTQTLYIYNQSDEAPFCENQHEFTVYVINIDVGSFDDVTTCDSYALPSLSVGNYYTKPNGKGEVLHAGDVLTTSQTIYVYGQKGDRFICESQTSFDVTISETPELPGEYEDLVKCGSYTLPILDNENYDIAYYSGPNGQSEITPDNYTFDQPGEYTIYVRASAADNPDCFVEKQFDLKINPLRKFNIPDAAFCMDLESGEVLSPAYLNSGMDASIFDVEWYLNGKLVHTGADYEAVKAGEYTVTTTKKIPDDGTDCGYEPTTVYVRKSSQPIARAFVTEDFSAVASIRVEVVKGVGDNYIYRLDDGSFQPGNVFRNVESGIHTITVKDALNACGEDVLEVQVIKYPKFFTPNDDGQNDRWNIPDLADHQEAEIFIYDRYGKFITKIKPGYPGWDGSYNGHNALPADYWFKVTYRMKGQDRQFTSHFTLKR